MSHFLVLVVGAADQTALAAALQPFHEFECTGIDDQYIQNIDKTAECLEEFQTQTATRYRDPAGLLHDPYLDAFYRDPTEEESKEVGTGTGFGRGLSWTSRDWGDGQGYRTKVHFLPEGWEEMKVPWSEVETFAEFVESWNGLKVVPFGQSPDLADEHKYGYATLNEDGSVAQCISRTNPNDKWDWWEIGGRYSNRILTKDGTRCDSALKGEIDFERLRKEAAAKAAIDYDAAQTIIAGRTFVPWSQILTDYEGRLDEGRDFYHAQPVIRDWRAVKERTWDEIEDYTVTRERFIQLAELKSFATFAVLKDGQWYQRGEMGWWGCVSDDTGDTWYENFRQVINDLPDDTRLTFVDCHI